ncbi:hypothetical protein [Bradyrhizobium commune]|nr:hypothetical protein [Bradyrhizobium commune]
MSDWLHNLPVLIDAHDRPFTGQISISPEPLRQVMPEEPIKG